MVTPSDIVDLARKHSHARLICGEDQDLLRATGMEGDAANAFFDAYAEEFSVDMADFLWFFHYDADEPPFYRRVRPIGGTGRAFGLIPITPRLLADAANEGRWPLEYPEHRIRVSHWPLVIMFLLLGILVLAITVLVAQDLM